MAPLGFHFQTAALVQLKRPFIRMIFILEFTSGDLCLSIHTLIAFNNYPLYTKKLTQWLNKRSSVLWTTVADRNDKQI